MESQNISFYLSVFRQRLGYFLLPVVLVTTVGTLAAFLLPSVYVGVAKILVESPRISADLARSAVPTDAIEQLQILEQELSTRVSLLAMARRFGIYADQPDVPDAEIASDMQTRTTVQPIEFTTPRGSAGAIAFSISFEADNPDLAAEVANAYAAAILERDASERRSRAADALDFFKREADRLQTVLDGAQDEILRFKRDHQAALPDTLEFRRMQQSSNEERLRQLQREEVSLQHRRSSLEQIIADTVHPSAPTADEQMLMDLRKILAEQRAVFSDRSPNLQMLRARIAELENQLATRPTGPTDISQRDDISPDLRVQFADINGQLGFIAQEKEAIAKTLSSLANSIAETAGNATVLSTLERTYETAQAQHNEAVARLAEASTGQRIETEEIGEKLSLIEPATPPLKPVRPNRRAIAAGSLIMGIVLGFGLVALLELWAPTIRRPADLASVFEGQPFATIPYIRSTGQTLRRRAGAMALVFLMFASIPGILLLRTHLPTIHTALTELSKEIRAASRL
jgi:uncharacterized protein involved in exopolysaccharide biosynthesis